MDVLGNPVSHFIGNVPDGTVPVLPVHERHPDTAGIDAATAAHHGHVVLGFRHLGQIVLQLGGHRIGALNAGIGGKLDLHIETAFIGAGHVLPADDAQRHHGRKEGQRQGCACKEFLFMMKAPVERLFVEILHPFFYPVHRPPELPVRYVETFFEESGGQHGCEGKRNEKGKERCKNDGQSELAEELAGHAGHEGYGQVHHHIADRNGNRRHTDFHTALHRRLFWTFPSGQMAVDIFQHHNGIVYQDADTEGHTHERHHVEGKASQVHGKKGSNQGGRNGNHDGRCGTPAPKEEKEYQACGEKAFHQGAQGIMEGCPHVSSRIVDDDELIVGILFSQLLQHCHDSVGRGNQVGIAVLVNGYAHGVLAVDPGIAGHFFIFPHHVSQGGNRYGAAALGGDIDFLDVLHRMVLRIQPDLGLPAVRVGGACRSQLVFSFQSRNDVIHGNPVVGQLVPVYLDRNFGVSAAGKFHIRHTVGLGEIVGQRIVCQRIHFIQRMGRNQGQVQDRRCVHIPLFHHRVIGIIRKAFPDGIHLLGSVHRRCIHIGIKIKLQGNLGLSGPGLGSNMLDIGHRRQSILHGLGHLLLHRFRIGAVIGNADYHIGRIDFRIQFHPQAVVAVKPQGHEEEDDHDDAHRMGDGVAGHIQPIHTVPSTSTVMPSFSLEILVTAARSPSEIPVRISMESSL